MVLKKVFLLFFLILINFSLAQEKRKVDTVYVYEKVIVYDTVYLEKALKIKPVGIHSKPLVISDMNAVREEPGFEYITISDTTKGLKIKAKKFAFGVMAGMGLKHSSWDKDSSEKSRQPGFNSGIWISGSIYKRFSIMLSANVFYWLSTLNLDATKEDTPLSGFYFTRDQQPLLFQRFNNKHFEYVLQVKAMYEWKKFRPSVGFSVNKNTYKMQFLVPENQILNKLDDFKNNQINVGFSLGLQYQISSRFLIDLEYQYYKIKHFSLKNTSFDFDIFKTNNTFAESKISLGVSYLISRF